MFSSSAYAFVSLTFSAATTPSTIVPGSQATLLLTISNTGTDFAGSPQLVMQSTPYITAGTGVLNLPSISAGGSTTLTIPISISASSPEGTVAVPFIVTYTVGTNSGTVSANNAATLIITKRTLLQITDVSYSENIIQRGDTFRMSITVKNVGNGQVKDLTVSLRNFSLPIVPATTDTQYYVGSLSSGESTTVNFDLIANANAETITYGVPVSLSYYDDQGTLVQETKYAGLKISGIPDFIVSLDRENVNAGGTLTVSIANRGSGSANYVAMYVSSDVDIFPTSNYVGILNPDDTSSVTLNVNSGRTGRHDMNITLNYKDSYNQDFSKSYILSYNLISTPVNVSPTTFVVIVVILAALAYWKRNFLKNFSRRILKRK